MDVIRSKDELEFAIFCIENTALHLQVSAERVYDAWTRKSDLLNRYVLPSYNILHTQGRDYIVEDIIVVMQEEGVTV